MLKISAGFKGELQVSGDHFRAVVMDGVINHEAKNIANAALETGSYFGSNEKALHSIVNASDKAAVIYIRTNGSYILRTK